MGLAGIRAHVMLFASMNCCWCWAITCRRGCGGRQAGVKRERKREYEPRRPLHLFRRYQSAFVFVGGCDAVVVVVFFYSELLFSVGGARAHAGKGQGGTGRAEDCRTYAGGGGGKQKAQEEDEARVYYLGHHAGVAGVAAPVVQVAPPHLGVRLVVAPRGTL